jgi:hypothetical protein
MKDIIEGFKLYLNEQSSKALTNRVYKIDLVIRLSKLGGVDIKDTLNKIRTIPGVTVIRQNQDVDNYEQYYVIDASVKFMTRGKGAAEYVRAVLVPYVNSNLQTTGVPNASVRFIKWRSLKEV